MNKNIYKKGRVIALRNKLIKSFNVARPFSSVNCVSTSNGLLNKTIMVCSNVSGLALGLNERVGFAVRLVANAREGKGFDILFIQ